MRNNKGIIIIYLEGDRETACKQEKYFFEVPQSKRIWDFSSKKLGYREILIYRSEKSFRHPIHFEQFQNDLNAKIKKFFRNKNKKILILITGDHDEISNTKILENTEEISRKINDMFLNKENIESKIILERHKNFKLETLMGEFSGCPINKKILKLKTGSEYPTIHQFFKGFHKIEDETIIKKIFHEKLINSKHKLLVEIVDNSPKK